MQVTWNILNYYNVIHSQYPTHTSTSSQWLYPPYSQAVRRLRLKCDGTRTETRFRLSAKQTSPFKSAGASVQSTTGNRGVPISGSNAGYTMFRGSVKGTGYPLLRQFPLHFPTHASPCAITFQLDSTTDELPITSALPQQRYCKATNYSREW